MKSIVIEATSREDRGKKHARKLRREGLVPGVLYGDKETILFAAPKTSFKTLLASPGFATTTLKIDGREISTIVMEKQFHVISDDLTHIDLLALTPGKEVTTEIPIRTEGRAKGVIEGGKLITKVRTLKIKAAPEHLVDFITIDVTNLELNKSINVGELNKLLPNMEIMHADSIPVVSIIIPRVLKAEEPVPGAAVATAAAPEAKAEEGKAKEGDKKEAGKKEPAKKEGAKKEGKK